MVSIAREIRSSLGQRRVWPARGALQGKSDRSDILHTSTQYTHTHTHAYTIPLHFTLLHTSIVVHSIGAQDRSPQVEERSTISSPKAEGPPYHHLPVETLHALGLKEEK